MNHLKSYSKLFEDKEDTLQTLKDICLDLGDEGFIIRNSDGYFGSTNTMDAESQERFYNIRNTPMKSLTINKVSSSIQKSFKIIDTKDTINRIKSYLGGKLYYVAVKTRHPFGSISWFNFNTLSDDTFVVRIIILYN